MNSDSFWFVNLESVGGLALQEVQRLESDSQWCTCDSVTGHTDMVTRVECQRKEKGNNEMRMKSFYLLLRTVLNGCKWSFLWVG